MVKSLIKKALDKHTKNDSFRFSFLVSRFSFLAISVFLIATSANSQIKIKERVEISPQEIISDYIPPQYTPCGPYILQTDYYNPYQVIWNGGWFYIDPFQQLFNYQKNYYTYSLDPSHYYNVTITTGAEYCYIVKSGYWDPDEDEFYYPEIIGDELLNVQGIKLIGTGDWVPAICSRWEKENPPGYYILFERDVPEGSEVIITIDDLTVGNSINYHTRIEIPLMELENRTDLDTLYHFYARFINVEAKRSEIHSQCGACWGQFPSSVKFTIEVVQGQEYGSLYDTETDQSALSFTNIETEWGSGFIFTYEDGERFKYVADGIQPDSSEPGLVTIRITPSDGDLNTIEFSFFVAYNEDPPEEGVIVIFAEQQIAPGDTTQIILKRRSSDGTLEDFSEWDSFEIGMLEGCDAGQILVGGVLAPYFEEVNQPIYFVAASDLTETDTVKVRVGLIESGASRPVQTNDKDREIITLRKNKTTQQKPLIEFAATYCFPGEIDWPKNGDGFVVVGDECDDYSCGEGFQYSPPNIVSEIEDIIWSNTFTNENGTRDLCPSTYAKQGRTWILFDEAFSVPYGSPTKIKNELIADYKIDACFKDNRWQYVLETNGDLNKIKLRVLVALCHWGEPTDINDINELSIIAESEACVALKDFEKHRPYQFPGMNIPHPEKYHIKDVTVNHEKVHVKFFQLDIIETLAMEEEHYSELKSFREHLKFTPECNEKFYDKKSAIFEGKKYYDKLLKKFVKKLKNVHASRFPDFWTQENYVQWNDYVQNTINYYQRVLKSQHSLYDCDYEMDWSDYKQFKNKF